MAVQDFCKKENTCCFTGPRPKKLAGYHTDYRPLINETADYLEKKLMTSPIDTFLSGGAQGFDMVAFWAVEKIKASHPDIRNILVLPYETQADIWAETGTFSKKEWEQMRHAADREVIIAPPPANRQEAVRALFGRNSAMIDNSAYTIALYPINDSFTPKNARGGTGDAIRKAITAKTELTILGYTLTGGIHLNNREIIIYP